MKINNLFYFAIINIISSSIIPIPFEYINGEIAIQIQQSKNKITCYIDTLNDKNIIPEMINQNSSTKRQYEYKDPKLNFFDRLAGKKSVTLYDDWFYINNIGFIMKYYVSPNINKCIISFSKYQTEGESLINILYMNKKISTNGFGIKYNEPNDNNDIKGIIYLGGLPEKEKKGLYSFSYESSFFDWNLEIEFASVNIKENTFPIDLFSKGYIDLKREEVLVTPKFYKFLFDHIYGFYIKEDSCAVENDNLVCDCKELKNIKSFESINLNIGGLVMTFNIENSFIKMDNKCYFIFKRHNDDFFLLGRYFWQNYKFEFLNKNQIIFYSKNKFNIKKISKKKKFPITILRVIIHYPKISFLIIIIIIISFVNAYGDKNKVKIN